MLTLVEREQRTGADIQEVKSSSGDRGSGPSPVIGKCVRVLDEGYVRLRDYLGDDYLIEEAARQSYGEGTRKTSETQHLLRYLYRHGHSTPFEMGELLFIVRCPMDMSRQLIRHRAASMCEEGSMFDEPSVNEYSTRYSLAIDHAATTSPEAWRAQAKGNKQGSGDTVTQWPEGWQEKAVRSYIEGDNGSRNVMMDAKDEMRCVDPERPGDYLSGIETDLQERARFAYEERLQFGVAREQARKDLPLSTYTQFYMKCDLRNMLHFFSLRLDSHAQYEIRQYAKAMAAFAEVLFPLTWQAFLDYDFRQGGLLLSAQDLTVLQELLKTYADVPIGRRDFAASLASVGWPTEGSHREREECYAKLVRMGIFNK